MVKLEHNPTPNVFLSYTVSDKTFVEQLAAWLQSLNFDCWWDAGIRSNPQGYQDYIEERLKNCDIFLVLWTPDSIKSRWVNGESLKAQALEKKIVMVAHNINPSEIPVGLFTQNAHFISDFSISKDDPSIDKLYEDLLHQVTSEYSASSNVKPSKDAKEWSSIYISTNPEDYINFISANPRSEYLRLAKSHLAQLEIWNLCQDLEPQLIQKILNSNPYPALKSVILQRYQHSRMYIHEKDSRYQEYKKVKEGVSLADKYVPNQDFILWTLLICLFVFYVFFLRWKEFGGNWIGLAIASAILTFLTTAFSSVLISLLYKVADFFLPASGEKYNKMVDQLAYLEEICPWVKTPRDPRLKTILEDSNFDYQKTIDMFIDQRFSEMEKR